MILNDQVIPDSPLINHELGFGEYHHHILRQSTLRHLITSEVTQKNMLEAEWCINKPAYQHIDVGALNKALEEVINKKSYKEEA